MNTRTKQAFTLATGALGIALSMQYYGTTMTNIRKREEKQKIERKAEFLREHEYKIVEVDSLKQNSIECASKGEFYDLMKVDDKNYMVKCIDNEELAKNMKELIDAGLE